MTKLDDEILGFSQRVFKNFGLDTLSSKIIAILYTEPEEVSIEKLAEKTGYSLGSVSTKTRFLEGLSMITKIKKPGSKRIFYYMEKDLFKLMEKKIEKGYEAEINPAKNEIPKILDRYKDSKLSEPSKKKLKIIENYYEQIKVMDQIFTDLISKLKEVRND
ncbi:MAG: GbsR/MarR family transcriptional regulator [Nanobdellota archaeon]